MREIVKDPQKIKTKKERKPLTKKQKTILITVIAVVSVLVVATVVTLLVLHFTKDNVDGTNGMPSRKIQYEYYIDDGDTVGFTLNDSFRENIPLNKFTRTEELVDNKIVLTDDLVLKVMDGATLGATGTFNFSYKGVLVAVINVVVVDADAYVHTPQEFFALPNDEDKTYIVRNNLDFTGLNGNISRFIGKLHFNHHEIKGFDASNGGLFKELNGATITGLDLIDVSGESALTDFCNFGVIADYSNNSKLRYCSISGKVDIVSTAEANDLMYLGGFVGYANALKRKSYVEVDPAYTHLVSFLDVSVVGTGDFRVGGLIGGVRNASVANSFAYGNIDFSVSEQQVSALKNLYLGGIVGALSKEYDTITQTYYLDESKGLYSYGDINVSVQGGGVHNYLNIGGVFGYVENHSLVNCTYGGKMNANLTRTTLNIGGIVGCTHNDTSLKMNVRGIIVKGEIKVYSLSNVYAGGIIGESNDTQYSSVDQSITPTIETDKAKVQGTQVATSSVGVIK